MTSVLKNVCTLSRLISAVIQIPTLLSFWRTYGDECPWEEEKRDQGDDPHRHSLLLCFLRNLIHGICHSFHPLSGDLRLFGK